SFDEFKKINLGLFDWLHFEGRNIEQTLKMMVHAKQYFPELMISVEIEKVRKNIEQLIEPADIIIFSKHYALTQGFNTANDFCRKTAEQYSNKAIFCAWGSSGAAALVRQKFYWQNAFLVDAIDTLAAGDVFNAGIIDQQIKQQTIQQSLITACKLAAQKCMHKGIVIN
ncbi:MAG: ketohexokinase, partial [Gammaproteobacteria bacterium]